jgi:hypothetical protein
VGRAAHQGPDVDGVTLLPAALAEGEANGVAAPPRPGDVVRARVVGAHGVDLVAAVEAVVLRGPEPAG